MPKRISGRGGQNKIHLDKDKVIEIYLQKKSLIKVGNLFNCSYIPIYRILKENNINTSIKGRRFTEEHKKNLRKPKSNSENISKALRLSYLNGARIKKFGILNPMFGGNFSKKHRKKLSDIRKGITISEKTRAKISKKLIGHEGLKGEKSPSWLGGKSFEPYNSEFNNRFKRAIRKRDNYECSKCNIHQEKLPRTLTIHHINYDKKLTIPQNCCALCIKCNGEVNKNRQHWTKFFQSLLAEKYGYNYSEDGKIILNLNNQEGGRR